MKTAETAVARALERLGHREVLEDFGARFPVPHSPRYELHYFRAVHRGQLTALAVRIEPGARAGRVKSLVLRGRLRRLLGDAAGAIGDFRKALSLDGAAPEAHLFLGEALLNRPEAVECLSRAAAQDPKSPWPFLYRGAANLMTGNLKAATRDLETFTCRRPKTCLGYLLLGLSLKKIPSALRAFAGAAKNDPTCSAAWILLARLQKGKEAARTWERAFDAEPDYAHIALYRWGPERPWTGFLEELGAYALDGARFRSLCARHLREDIRLSPYHYEALDRAARLLKLHPGRAWSLALAGRALCRLPQGAPEASGARALLDRTVRLLPKRGWVYAWRALADLREGRRDRALADMNEALALDPFYYRTYAWRGGLLRRQGKVRAALNDLDRALEVDDLYPFSWHERSLARRALGDWLGAAQDLDRAFLLDFRYSWVFSAAREAGAEELARGAGQLAAAVKRHPQSASLRAWSGELRLRAGDHSGALRELEGAARLDPNHGVAQAWLGKALLEAGLYDQAERVLRRAAQLEPRAPIFRGWQAEAREKAGRPDSALALLDGVLKDHPNLWWVHQARARCQLAAGRPRLALLEAERSLVREGRSAEGYYLKALAQLALGRLPAAEAGVERALSISPHLGRAYALRAEIRRRRGRPDAALEDYRTVRDKFPYLLNEEERTRVSALLA